MPTRFEFATAGRIVFGCGALLQAGEIAAGFGRRALVCTGRGHERARPLLERLEAAGAGAVVWSSAGEPTVDSVRKGVEVARTAECDVVIGFGGGSAIDAAKAIAVLAVNEGEVTDYLEVVGAGRALGGPGLPCIAIPTTAGTGAEVTRNSVLGVPGRQVKVSLRSPHLLPRVAIVDPELTFGMPAAVTAGTGMDALTQLIEAYTSVRANPMTDGIAREGIAHAAASLMPAYEHPDDTSAREGMCVASLFGGLALANAGLGAVHGFAGPIGGMCPGPHGMVCARLLPLVLDANLKALRRSTPGSATEVRYAEIARIATERRSASPDDLVAWAADLVRMLAVPPLSAYGITQGQVPDIAARAAAASSMKGNPVQLGRDELAGILERAIDGP